MSPGRIIVDDHLVDAGKKTEPHKNRQPLRALCDLEAVPVLPLVLLLLYGVEPDEQIRLVHLVKVSEPGHELGWWIVTNIRHLAPRTKIGFEVSIDVRLRTRRR